MIAERAVHRGPDLVVARIGKADAWQSHDGDERRYYCAGKRRQFQRARADLRQHAWVAAQLIVGEEFDGDRALRLGADGGDGFAQAVIDRVRAGQVVAELEAEHAGIRPCRRG